jgi:hypothetical protein
MAGQDLPTARRGFAVCALPRERVAIVGGARAALWRGAVRTD